MADCIVSRNQVPAVPAAASPTVQWTVPYYVKGLALGIPIYFVAIHLWAWLLIVPSFLRAGSPDFRQIYSSAYMVRTGHSSQLYDYSIQKQFQKKLVSHRGLALPFIRPAYEALLFSPLSRFSFRRAYFIFAGFNVLCLGACFLLLRPWIRNLRAIYPWCPMAMLFGFYPISWAFVMGQDSVMLLAILIGTFVLLTRQATLAAGLLLGLGLFKFQVVLPVAALFFFWRRWRLLTGFGASAMCLGFASVWITGIPATREYFWDLTSIANLKQGVADYPVLWQMMANVHGFVFGVTSSWLPKFWFELVSLMLGLSVFAWTIWRGMRIAEDTSLLLLALPCSILVGHYAFMHDLSVLILPTFVLLDHFLPSERCGPEGARWIGRAAALMFVAPLIDSYFPNHTYLVALAVGALLYAMVIAAETHGSSVVGRPAAQTSNRAELTRDLLIGVARRIRIPRLNKRRMSQLGLMLLPVLALPPTANAQLVSTHAVSSGEFFIAFCCVVMVGIAANAFLVGLVRSGINHAKWQKKWEFSPATLGGFSWRNLALWSLLSLFMELLMIRWISSEIRIFAYFKNFVLIACFLGFGLGCYLSRRKINLLTMLVPLIGLTVLTQTPWMALRTMISQLPAFIGASAGMQVWGVPSALSLPMLAAAAAVIVPIFGLIAFSFVPMGQLVGWYLENSPKGTLAYSVNVFAALGGIVLYTSLCFLCQPPATWLLVGGILLIHLLWRVPRFRWTSMFAIVFCIAFLKLPPPKNSRVYWSPYQKLTLSSWSIGGKTLGYYLNTNDSWYQQILDLSPQFVRSHPQLFHDVPIEWNAYNIPYHFAPNPASVLVLGSGMGNDVAAALRNGAGEVTAVEIDPLILKLGERFHFERPYDSPRVHKINDDARSYVENTHNQFDLIVFSLLDSHTTSSYYTNIRIDNYVYTLEAIRAAKRLLKPDGIFIVKFQVDTPWIAGRLYSVLSQVFGNPPLQLENYTPAYTTGGRFFVTGSQQHVAKALSNPVLARYVEQHSSMPMETAVATTDDWPYFYQKTPGLPLPVVLISVVLVILCVLLLRDMGTPIKSLHWHFFFLGAGFLLLEAQIISKMALLFGTTWLVNSIVIGGLLILILLANTLVDFEPRLSVTVAYVCLLISLAMGYLVPVRAIFFASVAGRIVAATLLLCLPVFFAGIVFIKSFAQAGFAPDALGSNLLGAMAGGMLESVSLWTGIRSLALLAGLLYVASWVVLLRKASAELSTRTSAQAAASTS